MSVALQAQLMLLSVLVVGLIGSYAVSHGWIPDRMLLQPGRQDWARFRGRLPLTLFNLGVLMGGSTVVLSLIEDRFVPTPTLPVLLLQVVIVTAIDDTWFYFLHRALHEVPALYRSIHRIHHKAYAPLPLDYLYVHPAEWALGAIGAVGGLAAVALLWGGLSAASFLAYATLRAYHELHVHSGLRPWILHRIPLVGTVAQHDTHHAKPTLGNYGTALRLWDRLLGTTARA